MFSHKSLLSCVAYATFIYTLISDYFPLTPASTKITESQGFVMESVLTFALVFVILRTAVDSDGMVRGQCGLVYVFKKGTGFGFGLGIKMQIKIRDLLWNSSFLKSG